MISVLDTDTGYAQQQSHLRIYTLIMYLKFTILHCFYTGTFGKTKNLSILALFLPLPNEVYQYVLLK